MTASETWFYFPMVGVLGMFGICLSSLRLPEQIALDPRLALALFSVLLLVYGVRTEIRGEDWSSPCLLAHSDIRNSPDDYVAYYDLAGYYIGVTHNNYIQARNDSEKSISLYSTPVNNNDLGEADYLLGDYRAAYRAYLVGMNNSKSKYYPVYDNFALLTPNYGSPSYNAQLLIQGLRLFPKNVNLWYFLAIMEYDQGEISNAKTAISYAYELSENQSVHTGIAIVYNKLMNMSSTSN